MITLPDDRSMPLYQALYLQLRQEIQSGALPQGAKLPSKRKLSEQLGISVNTVDSAYCQLEAEGFIQASPRRGFFVLDAGLLPASILLHIILLVRASFAGHRNSAYLTGH